MTISRISWLFRDAENMYDERNRWANQAVGAVQLMYVDRYGRRRKTGGSLLRVNQTLFYILVMLEGGKS